MSRDDRNSHVVIDEVTRMLRCTVCGALEKITFPIKVTDFARQSRKFERAHESCGLQIQHYEQVAKVCRKCE